MTDTPQDGSHAWSTETDLGLLVVLQTAVGGSALTISDKTISGMVEYQKSWPGEVALAQLVTSGMAANIGERTRSAEDLPFRVVLVDSINALEAYKPALILANAQPNLLGLSKTNLPHVFVVESTPMDRSRNDALAANDKLEALRCLVSGVRSTIRLRRALVGATGVQHNGLFTFLAFAKANRNSMFYFDSRFREALLPSWVEQAPRPASMRLRVGFSGRRLGIKGFEDFTWVAQQCAALGAAIDFYTIGSNEPLGDELAGLGNLANVGELDFESEWTPWVANNLDVMLLPHKLGDNSGTFIETLGAGVPVLGYAHGAWQEMTKVGNLGWAVEWNNRQALLEKLLELAGNPGEVHAMGQKSAAFAAQHTFEHEFAKRVDHLKATVTQP